MKLDKITRKKTWQKPILRRIPATDTLVRKAEGHDPSFAAFLRQAKDTASQS